jgi:hypothetical protein
MASWRPNDEKKTPIVLPIAVPSHQISVPAVFSVVDRMHKRTDDCKTVYPPNFVSVGIIIRPTPFYQFSSSTKWSLCIIPTNLHDIFAIFIWSGLNLSNTNAVPVKLVELTKCPKFTSKGALAKALDFEASDHSPAPSAITHQNLVDRVLI